MLRKYRCSPGIDRMPHVFEAAYRAASIKNLGSKFPTHHQLLGPRSRRMVGARVVGQGGVGPCGCPGMIHAVRRGGQYAGE